MTASEALAALNARCVHATETKPKYLGDQRVRDCDECLVALLRGLSAARGGTNRRMTTESNVASARCHAALVMRNP